jgi:hypothetical protein
MSGIWGNLTHSVARIASSQAPGKLPEHLEPHKALYEILHTLAERSDYEFDMAARGTLLRFLFNTMYCRAEWIPFFLEDEEQAPTPRNANTWAWYDRNGAETYYRLTDDQRRLRDQAGPETVQTRRSPPTGKICGKTLKRLDRTYSCK